MKPYSGGRKLNTLNIKDLRHLCRLLQTSTQELDTMYSGLQVDPRKYYTFRVLEKNGKLRPLAIPRGRLREILTRLNSTLQRFAFPANMHGGIRHCSTRSYALPHVHQRAVLKSDVKDFFPSIGPRRVYRLFNERLGCAPDVARYLTRLTTVNGHLPQGSPTSTVVANLVAVPIGIRLAGLANSAGGRSGTFVDDIVLSGPRYIGRYEQTLTRIIRQEGFSPNERKTGTVLQEKEQVIAGIRVNYGLDVPSEKIKEVRDMINQLQSRKEGGVAPDAMTIRSVKGKIRYIASLNRGAAKSISNRLSRIGLLSKTFAPEHCEKADRWTKV